VYAIYQGLSAPREYSFLDAMEAERLDKRKNVDDGRYFQWYSISSPQGDVTSRVLPIADFFEYFTVKNTREMAHLLQADVDMRNFDSWFRDDAATDRLRSAVLRALTGVVPTWFSRDPNRDLLARSGLVQNV
jgi:hypothetical protein